MTAAEDLNKALYIRSKFLLRFLHPYSLWLLLRTGIQLSNIFQKFGISSKPLLFCLKIHLETWYKKKQNMRRIFEAVCRALFMSLLDIFVERGELLNDSALAIGPLRTLLSWLA